MTRAETIAANDALRKEFKGGIVLFTPAVWALDSSLRGRALYRMTLFDKFSDDSLHEEGVFVFAGLTFVWQIGTFDGQRSLTLSLKEDWYGT